MDQPLKEKLEAMNFVYVFNTSEEIRGQKKAVRRRTPRTHGRYRGVTVVYDNVGCPWIRSAPLTIEEMKTLNLIGPAKAYVPHVRDGFRYIRTHLIKFDLGYYPHPKIKFRPR